MAQRPDVVVLERVRLSFPKLFKPEASVEDGPKKFSAHAIMDPTTESGQKNLEKVKAAVRHVAEGMWGEKWQQVVKSLEKNRKALRDGDAHTNGEGDIYAGYEGCKFVVASNHKRPQTLSRRKEPVVEEDHLFYGGCYVDMVVSLYATKDRKQGGNGIFATLELVRFRADGEAFGAAPIDADDYLDDLDDDDDDAPQGQAAPAGDVDDDDVI